MPAISCGWFFASSQATPVPMDSLTRYFGKFAGINRNASSAAATKLFLLGEPSRAP